MPWWNCTVSRPPGETASGQRFRKGTCCRFPGTTDRESWAGSCCPRLSVQYTKMILTLSSIRILPAVGLATVLLPAQPNLKLDEVLFLYGVESQVSQIPAQIEEQIKSYDDEQDLETFRILREVLPRAYAKDYLMASVRETFYRESEGRDVEPTLEWLRSPVGTRISEAEAETSRPGALEKMMEFFEDYQDMDPDSPRVRMLSDLDEAAGVTESGVRLVLEMARSTARGVNHLAPGAQQVSEEGLEDQISQLEPQIRPALRESTKLLLYFKFRTLKDEEIRQYLEFARSPHGQWLQEAVMNSLVQALRDAGDRTGRLIDARIQESGD